MRAEVMGMGANGMSALAGDEEIRALYLPCKDMTKHRQMDPHRTPDLQAP